MKKKIKTNTPKIPLLSTLSKAIEHKVKSKETCKNLKAHRRAACFSISTISLENR